jgi:protein gp37
MNRIDIVNPTGPMSKPIEIIWPLPNVWLGVSVEDQQRAEERIPYLLKTPAVVRFLSVEPMLGPMDLSPWLSDGIGWVIIGCESGPGARPMKESWAATIIEQCARAGVPCFYKQAMVGGRLVKLPIYCGRSIAEFPMGATMAKP